MEEYKELGYLSQEEIDMLQLKLVEGVIECFKANNVLYALIDGTFQANRSLRYTFDFSYIYPYDLFMECTSQITLERQKKFMDDIKTTVNKILVKHFTIFTKNKKIYSKIRRYGIGNLDFRHTYQWRYVGNLGEGFDVNIFQDNEGSDKWTFFIRRLFDVNLKKFRDLLNAAQLHVNWSVKKGSLGLSIQHDSLSVK